MSMPHTVLRRPWRTAFAVTVLIAAALTVRAAPARADVVAPSAPTLLYGIQGNQKITLNWSPPDEDGGQAIDHYLVEESTNNGSSWTEPVSVTDTTDLFTGLTNGAPYEFQVAANNGVASGPFATTGVLSPHGPLDDTTITAPQAAVINLGDSRSLATTLTDTSTSKPLRSTSVDLLARPAGTTTYSTVTTQKTDSHGDASVTVKPKVNTLYRWSYGGDASHRGVMSTPSSVSVNQLVSVALTKPKVKHEKALKVYGVVKPRTIGEKVTLQQLKGRTWKPVADAVELAKQKLPNGKKTVGYIIDYAPAKKGNENLRVQSGDTHENPGAASKTLTLKVT